MFWIKSKTAGPTGENRPENVALEAEGLYRSGKMHCAEAVLAAVASNFLPSAGEDVVRMAAGFGHGSGSGCICGAVAGGSMAIGLVKGGERKRVMQLTRELHKWFKGEYGATCCKLITTKGNSGCALLTGRVAEKVAQLLELEG